MFIILQLYLIHMYDKSLLITKNIENNKIQKFCDNYFEYFKVSR